MNCETDKYRLLFEKMPDAFAYHQVIYDQQGTPVDYLFLEVNSAFEVMTGLKREQIINKKVTEVHPEIGESAFDWIGVYGQVALKGESTRFEQYFEPADRWYDVSAFSDTPGYFAVSFREVTLQKNENLALTKLAGLAQHSLQDPAGDFSYQAFSDGLLELSGARFAAIHIYEQDGRKTVTRAISGVAGSLRKICDLLGYELTGKAWDIIPERYNAIKEGRLLRFANLYDSASGAIPKKIAALLEKTFGVGEVYVVEVGFKGEAIGGLMMFMPRHKTLENPKVIELYATQVGFALMRHRVEEDLIALKTFNESIVQSITEGIIISDDNGIVTFTNPALYKMLGYDADQIIGMHWKLLVPSQDYHLIENAYERRREGKSDRYELSLKHRNGTLIPVQISGSPYRDSKTGKIVGTLAVQTNIAERKIAEEALRESEQRYRDILETIEDGFYEVDLRGKIVSCNRAAAKLLGYEENELVGMSYKNLCKDMASVYHEFNQAYKAGEPKFSVIMEMIHKDGSIVSADLSISLTFDKQGNVTGFRGLGRDMTERVALEDKLKHLSFHDQLTGLYNRRYFENELQRLGVSREHPVVVMSADLDGLKLINDTLGHAEGDRYLQTGAELLKGVLRASDILARVGGDEFALILPHTTKKAGEELIVRIRCRIDQYNRENEGLPISISIGLAVSKSGDQSLEEAYKKADNAMYDDKLKRGKLARAGIVASLIDSLSVRGNLGEGDSDQVRELCERMGQALNLDDNQAGDLQLLARVYDLGKVSMPDQLIHKSLKQKSAELTEAERETIRRHPEIGYRIASSSPELVGVADLILRHHEKVDGSGYPLGLKGEEIPPECKMLAVVTAYSAMTHSRPYAKTFKPAEAVAELKRCAGTQFDPQVVEAFLSLIESDLK